MSTPTNTPTVRTPFLTQIPIDIEAQAKSCLFPCFKGILDPNEPVYINSEGFGVRFDPEFITRVSTSVNRTMQNLTRFVTNFTLAYQDTVDDFQEFQKSVFDNVHRIIPEDQRNPPTLSQLYVVNKVMSESIPQRAPMTPLAPSRSDMI